jgi:hypothetical protein
MGVDALLANGMTHKIKYLLQDKHLTSRRDPLRKVRKSRIWLFLAVQLIGFGATFAITQTIGGLIYILFPALLIYLRLAAIGFPVIIMLLLPVRILLVPRLPFTSEELSILDGPAASPFVSPVPFVFPLKSTHHAGCTIFRPWSPLVEPCNSINAPASAGE